MLAVKASDRTASKILSFNKTTAETMNTNTSSSPMATTTTHSFLMFMMPSMAPVPVYIKRDPTWVKVDRAVDPSFFCSRKRKTLHVVAPSERQLPGANDQVTIARQMALSNILATPPSSSATSGEVLVEIPSESTVSPTEQHGESRAPTSGPNTRMIKCRVTGYPRLRLVIDDFENMWDAKDELRWTLWCEKEKEERGPMEDYGEGDSDCDWEEFKEKRQRLCRSSLKRRRRIRRSK
ncbi:hypothetical protein IFR05_013861 [Cadophora sp. M221]|nr:hypothetical protein IFR05_013861 [Cadophora sp. M221]